MPTPTLPSSSDIPEKRRAYNTGYPGQWWAASILLGPILVVLLGVVKGGGISSMEMFPVFLLFGLVFSLPTFGACWWAYARLIDSLYSAFAIKLLLNGIAIGGVLLTFFVIGATGTMAMPLIIVYASSIILASCCFRIYEP
ncbi:hypothetical protein H8B13_18965 [Hymenobacter sp. BT188]|uniref:hypothetical protein n=1 Tax=Hymenobacter sp. BT188 TaxID=2763504 RepID=UPI001651205D|nr:hypothetical protein [Hymenobacter sp. BT188]MBC6608910.1 hypothetical protein [Hymenobacter sp. BT188]